jgi:hypothetical protein
MPLCQLGICRFALVRKRDHHPELQSKLAGVIGRKIR